MTTVVYASSSCINLEVSTPAADKLPATTLPKTSFPTAPTNATETPNCDSIIAVLAADPPQVSSGLALNPLPLESRPDFTTISTQASPSITTVLDPMFVTNFEPM